MKNLVKNLQLLLLGIILLSTIIAVVLEIRTMFLNQTVTLADLLLMFLYLEVMAMVRVFWEEQSISISLPLLIAINKGKEMLIDCSSQNTLTIAITSKYRNINNKSANVTV